MSNHRLSTADATETRLLPITGCYDCVHRQEECLDKIPTYVGGHFIIICKHPDIGHREIDVALGKFPEWCPLQKANP